MVTVAAFNRAKVAGLNPRISEEEEEEKRRKKRLEEIEEEKKKLVDKTVTVSEFNREGPTERAARRERTGAEGGLPEGDPGAGLITNEVGRVRGFRDASGNVFFGRPSEVRTELQASPSIGGGGGGGGVGGGRTQQFPPITPEQEIEARRFLSEEKRPTDQTQLGGTAPFLSAEGQAEIKAATRAASPFKRIREFLEARTKGGFDTTEPQTPEEAQIAVQAGLAQIGVDTIKIIETGLVGIQGIGETFREVEFVGSIIGDILGDRVEKVNNYKASLDKRKEMANDVSQNYNDGYIDLATAIASLDSLEKQLSHEEDLIQQQAILSPEVRRSGVLEDIQTTMLQQRQDLFDARNRVFTQSVTGNIDAEGIAFRLERLERFRDNP